MRIDLPFCGFNRCKYHFDGNCIDDNRYDSCDYRYDKEEREALITGQETLQKHMINLQAENEDIKFLYENLKEEHLEIIKAIKHTKAEAYKECIEKVKTELGNIAKIEWQSGYYYLVGEAFFDNLLNDNLLKELVGE